MKLFDKYNREARVTPAILALLPAIVLIVSVANKVLNIYYGVFSGSFLLFLVIYFAADIVRNIGKYWEGKIFKNGLSLPTTEVMLHGNQSLTDEKKKRIYKKIENEQKITLYTKEEEINDEIGARKKINEAIAEIRQNLRNNPILLQTNIRYGLWRNLISVSFFSFLLSAVSLAIAYVLIDDYITAGIEFLFVAFFLSIWMYRNQLLYYFGFQYADQFFLEYLAKK